MGTTSPPGLEEFLAHGPRQVLTRPEQRPVETLGQQAITYDDWMEQTKLAWNHPRSSRLKAIDKALKAREADPSSMAKATALRTAINDWIRWKGVNTWKTSQRNTEANGHIVERLRVWAFAPDLPTAMTKEEEAAYQAMEDRRRKAVQTMFQGKRVQLKIQTALMKGASAASDAKRAAKSFKDAVGALRSVTPTTHHAPDLGRGVTAVGTAGKFVKDQVLDLDNLSPDTLRTAKDLVPIDEIVTDFIPFVNLVVGGVMLLVKWGKVAQAARAVHTTEQSRYVIELGDPQKAFDGVMTCLKRDRTSKAIQASQATAKFSAQTAGTFVDLGAATGPTVAAVNAAATLAHKLFLFGREMKEVSDARKILKDPDNLDFRLFQAYPLAGCYMIACATLSDIICMSTVQFGNPGWMDDIELMKSKYIDPLRKHCNRFIVESLFEFPDMPLRKK